jgi:hypothetical protein
MLLLLEAEAGEVWISFLCLVGGECVSVWECDPPFYSSGRLHSKFLWRSQVKYWISFIIKIKYE